jgi:hypothetical protein
MPSETAETPRPRVIVDFIFDEGVLFVAVDNIGERPALEVSVRFQPAFCGAGGVSVPALPLFRNIEFLAPRKSIRTILDSSAEYFGRGEPTRIEARIAYSDAGGNRYADTIRHDLEIYRDIAYLVRSPPSG